MDLMGQLRINLKQIIHHYGDYVRCIRTSMITRGVCVRDLSDYLLTLSAFSHGEQQLVLLTDSRHKLESAVEIGDIFRLLTLEYSSFLIYDLFEGLIRKYDIDIRQDELRYPEHLAAYVRKHTIEEFIQIIPRLGGIADSSEKLTLILDINQTQKLSKINVQ